MGTWRVCDDGSTGPKCVLRHREAGTARYFLIVCVFLSFSLERIIVIGEEGPRPDEYASNEHFKFITGDRLFCNFKYAIIRFVYAFIVYRRINFVHRFELKSFMLDLISTLYVYIRANRSWILLLWKIDSLKFSEFLQDTNITWRLFRLIVETATRPGQVARSSYLTLEIMLNPVNGSNPEQH